MGPNFPMASHICLNSSLSRALNGIAAQTEVRKKQVTYAQTQVNKWNCNILPPFQNNSKI